MNALAPFRRKNEIARNGTTGDPFSELRSEINSLFDRDFWNWESPSLFDGGTFPALDVKDGENEVEVRCDLPGVDRKNVDISVSGNILTIKGEKRDEKEEKDSSFYRRESWSGSFHRSIALPEEVDGGRAEASLKDGVLKLVIPKREEKKPKKIEVKVK
jgi:HSP20 family protein